MWNVVLPYHFSTIINFVNIIRNKYLHIASF